MKTPKTPRRQWAHSTLRTQEEQGRGAGDSQVAEGERAQGRRALARCLRRDGARASPANRPLTETLLFTILNSN